MKVLHDDLVFWLCDECEMTVLELVARFHHRLVYIHPFANGNGRWGRLMTSVLAVRELGLSPITWAAGADDLRDPESNERKKYIATIKAADKGDFASLMEYLKGLNPELA
jgi:Fic family protein